MEEQTVIRQAIARLVERQDLTADDAEAVMSEIMCGEATPAQIGAFLTALRMKGETIEEITGCARAMRKWAVTVRPKCGRLMDTAGTGGDGRGTFNISTITAFVLAGAGVAVAKHGNRSVSSRCGSADLMEALGVRIELTPEQMGRAIREVGIGFLFAPAIHKATRHAQPVRRELRLRTVFNYLGPLTNPAGASAQLVGAPTVRAAELMAGALAELGLERGFVVHGSDGLDEITTTGPTLVFEIRGRLVTRREVTPEEFGVSRARPEDLRGGDAEANCEIARAVLGGERGPRRDITLVNAAAALVVAGRARDFREGMEIAANSVDSGAAWRKVKELVEFTQRLG
ncbi:MAG: anthranilate phosphoribosyltransferase [Bryobacteraceae bacterium]|nr:anthranilate phosphoribosyltransferase [Bryobacteraceae bacterium]